MCISFLFVEHKHNFSGSGSSVFSGGKSSEADCWSFAIYCCSAGTLLHNTRPHQVSTMGNTSAMGNTQQCRVIMGVCHSLLFRRDTTTQYATPSGKNNGQHSTMCSTQQYATQQCRVTKGICHSLLFRHDNTQIPSFVNHFRTIVR